MTGFETITDKLSQAELLAQLAEEAVELAHAALKLRRVYEGTNPTPVKRSDAFDNLKEEIADVKLLLLILGLENHGPEYMRTMEAKLRRWEQRLLEG